MAHALETFTDGTTAFFSNRETPWHKLGTLTEGAQTAADALRLAQLDWEVTKAETHVQTPIITEQGVSMVEVPGKFITYRNHPKNGLEGLGVVGSQYQVIQNSEAFDFLTHLVDESGAVFETAGSLDNGRRVFMSLRLPQTITIGGGQDTVDMYLMATTSHDGTKSFTAAVTPIRPVCSNTVAMGLARAKSKWNLKHTTNVKGKVAQAREALGMAFRYTEEFQIAVDSLASEKFSEKEFASFLNSLMPTDKNTTVRQQSKITDAKATMQALWNAPTQANIAWTRWAAYNTVTEYADWAMPIRGKETDKDLLRAQRIFTGTNDAIKQRAYDLLAV